MALNIRHI